MANNHFEKPSAYRTNYSLWSDSELAVKPETKPAIKTELTPTSELERGSSLTSANDEASSVISPPTTNQPLIITAVDFGTTYSGVAHAFVSNGASRTDNIEILQSWPGSSQTSDKVPTRFAYVEQENRPKKSVKCAKGQTAASETSFRWGYGSEPGEPEIRFIKLLLESQKELPEHMRREDIEAELKKHDKNVIQAVADFLRKLREEAEESLVSKYGESRIHGTRRQTVLTVPAIWSDAAKEATKQAAVLAGFPGDIILVSEPEAAAIWTIKNSPSLEPKIGDIYVVVDAGGGTCDLISYEVTQLSPLRLKEAAVGSGGLCGGSFANQRFRQRISDKMGQTSFEKFVKDNPKSWHNAEKDFEENVKRNFDPKSDRTFHISCPRIKDNAKAGIRKGHIALTTENLREIFAPITTEIMDLISKQVESLKKAKKHPTAILLVGGFGTAKYLYETVKKTFQPRRVEVLQPADAWGAVVKGAVLYASEAHYMIQSRISRFNYGVKYNAIFDANIHQLSSRYWHDLKEEWMVTGLFKCYIECGESVSVADPISHEFCRSFELHEPRKATSRLFASAASTPPTSLEDPSMTTVCTLHTDLSKVPAQHWKYETNSKGIIYVTIDYEMKISLESGGLRFWLEIDGVEYAAVTASFDSV